jgi:hypothetical protein
MEKRKRDALNRAFLGVNDQVESLLLLKLQTS